MKPNQTSFGYHKENKTPPVPKEKISSTPYTLGQSLTPKDDEIDLTPEDEVHSPIINTEKKAKIEQK